MDIVRTSKGRGILKKYGRNVIRQDITQLQSPKTNVTLSKRLWSQIGHKFGRRRSVVCERKVSR